MTKIASKGGKARAEKLSAADRKRIAKTAAAARERKRSTSDERESMMRNRKQNGTIIRIGDRWYVRFWEHRNIGGSIERKRVTHQLGPVTTRGKRPPRDIEAEAERYMATINNGAVVAERIVTICDFVDRVYLPWIEQHKRPSTARGYRDIWEDHLKPHCGKVC
jgi:hypothetical protein